jgi:hypothetical protein
MRHEAPLAPREAAQAAVDGDTVLLWGGEADYDTGDHIYSSATFQDGAVYDARTRTWAHVPAPPIAPRGFPLVALADGRALVWGGSEYEPIAPDRGFPADAGASLDDGAVYDLATGEWQAIPPAPIDAMLVSVAHWDGERLFVWAGGDGAVWTGAGGWRAIAPFPLEPRGGAAVAVDEDHVVVWGGGVDREGAGERLFSDGAVYDRRADRWEIMPDAPLSERSFSNPSSVGGNALIDDGRALIAGGAETSPDLVYHHDGAWFDIDAGTWAPIATGPAAARYVDGHQTGAYAVDDGGDVPRVWLYDLAGDRWLQVDPLGTRSPQVLDAGRTAVIAVEGPELTTGRDWTPVTVMRQGQTRTPVVDDDHDARFFASYARLHSGVLLWGGLGVDLEPDGSYAGSGGTTDTGWFLPAPRR